MMEPKWRRRIQHMWQPIGKQRTHLNTDFSQRLSIIAKAHKQIPINRPSGRYVICIYLSRWLDPCAIICCCVYRWFDPRAIFAVVYILIIARLKEHFLLPTDSKPLAKLKEYLMLPTDSKPSARLKEHLMMPTDSKPLTRLKEHFLLPSSPLSGLAAIKAAMEKEDEWTVSSYKVNLLDGMCFNIQ